ncbi:unnamed protein product [Arctogadus glacialis]
MSTAGGHGNGSATRCSPAGHARWRVKREVQQEAEQEIQQDVEQEVQQEVQQDLEKDVEKLYRKWRDVEQKVQSSNGKLTGAPVYMTHMTPFLIAELR